MPDSGFSIAASERLAAYFHRLTEPTPLRARAKQEWIQRRGRVREGLWAALGLAPAPDRLSLEPVSGPETEAPGCIVQRVAWQIWPAVWASGTLCRPSGAAQSGAALLLAGMPVQAASLARCSYTVLAPDTWEIEELAMGLTSATVNTWTWLRGLDYLAALPSVDRERMGVADLGQATPEALLAFGLDDRVRAGVFPTGAATAELPGLLRFTSAAELHALASPRAMLVLGRDEALLGPLRAVYRLWLQPDRLAQGAGSKQVELLGWLQRELRGVRAEAPLPPEPAAAGPEPAPVELPASNRGAEGIREWFRKRVVAQPPQLESKASRRTYQDRLRAELRVLLGEPVPVPLDPEVVSTETGEGSQVVALHTEQHVRIPALWLPGDSSARAVVAAYPGGRAVAGAAQLVAAFRAAGWAVLAPDVRFHGEMGAQPAPRLEWGRPEAGMVVDDLAACVQWLFEHEGVDFRQIVLLGAGALGIPALLAAGQDERVAGAVADCGGTTYRDGGDLPAIPGILRVADVPQIASLVAPRPLWLYHVPAERVGFSSRRYYDWTRRTYQSLGDEEGLKMSPDSEPDPEALLAWLEPRLKRQGRKRSF